MRFAPITLALLSAAAFVVANERNRFGALGKQLVPSPDLDPNDRVACSKEAGRFAILAPKLQQMANSAKIEEHRVRYQRMSSTAEKHRDDHIGKVEELTQKALSAVRPGDSPKSAEELREDAEGEYAKASKANSFRGAGTQILYGAQFGALARIKGGPPRMNSDTTQGGRTAQAAQSLKDQSGYAGVGPAGQAVTSHVGTAKRKSPEVPAGRSADEIKKMRLTNF